MQNIFRDHAQKYWVAGLPAIPLVSDSKRPAIPRWQTYSDAFPTKEDQEGWLNAFACGNIGLPMGPAAGLVAIDIDTEDPVALQVLDRVLPSSPWARVGRKGRVQIYRWSNERTARIKDADGNMICEILSKGTQFVLPPSIHPDTKLPYTANCDLWEVAKIAPPLPHNFEKTLKGALREAGIDVSLGGSTKTVSWVAAGARDATMTSMAGILARAVLRGERSLYEALAEMAAWVDGFVEKVVGDPLSVDKAQAKVVEFLIRDVTGEARRALPLGWDEGLSGEDLTRLGLSFTDDDKSWSQQKMLDYLTVEFARHEDPRSAGRGNAINVVLGHLARCNPPMTYSEEESILSFIAAASLRSRTLPGLKKDLQRLRRGDIMGDTHAELAEACLAHLSKYGEVRYDASKFWQWRGASWEELRDAEILKTIAENFGTYPLGRRQGDHAGILKVMKATAASRLCASPYGGVNFANGFLTEDLRLVPHAPDYGMVYTLPYRYMPEQQGHMPMFDQFLNDCWSKDADYGDKLLALQEAVGVSLMGKAPQYQMAFLLYGQPGAGKSVLQSIMKGLLPAGSSSSIPPTDWADKFLPAEMFGKIVNFAGELPERRPIPGDVFKMVISGEQLTVQFKNQHPFVFEPKAAHWFNSNHMPKTHDSSDGFNRRWLVFEFNTRVDPSKRVIDLDAQILEHEREAIVAWAIQGYARLREQGKFTLPASHRALIETMAADNNSVRHFLTSAGTPLKWGEGLTISLTDLHALYWQFMLASGSSQRVDVQKFARMMRELSGALPFEPDMSENMVLNYCGVGV